MTAAASSLERMEGLLRELMFLQLRSLGLFSGSTFTAQSEMARIDRRFGKWFDETLRILERGDYLRRDGANYAPGAQAAATAGWNAWEIATAQWFDDPAFAAQARLVDAMVRALPDILTGKRLATEVLFADASVGRVEGIYQGTTNTDYFNAVLAEVAAAYIEQRAAAPDGERVRILEIGAGTGGTSAALFARLKPFEAAIAEYCYTDISKAFLGHAQDRYAPSVPYLVWKLFNVEKTPQEQGIDTGAYDLVVATNVLHATRDIRNTLRNAKAALQRDGLLLLNEMHVAGSSLTAHLTFGLTDGWWLFEDDVLRIAGTPALAPETWQSVLNAEGYEDVFFPAQAGHAFGQQIVVARSDGVVQQPVRAVRKPASVAARAKAPRPAATAGAADAAQRARISEALLDRLCRVLKLDAGDVDFDAAFADYGLDSIVGIEFVKALNESLSLGLETTVIFDYSSITQLTGHIVERYPDAARVDAAAEAEAAPLPARRVVAPAAPVAAVRNGPIAVVGMSGRFARSPDLDALWQHLANGDDLVEESRRWGAPQPGDGRYPYGSFIDGIDEFDAMFFNISGVEARYMDPKQRLFLEEAWKALEDAGYAGEGIRDRRCGVYVGCEPGDYSQLFGGDVPAQAMWGTATSIVPARIAYYLDLQGAAIAVDTACSSALVATHLGCQALWNGELDIIIAGGVSIGCAPSVYGGPAAAGMLSSTGRCYTFDARANGFVPGEGVGAIVLKRLDDALADRDVVHGVIRGSGINQDGATNGITAPSARSQERLESQVYDTFGVHPDEIDLIEAHGTGTPLGDPIEINALTRAFRRKTARRRYCAIGTIKSNLGHSLAASGMAGLFKVLLSLKHRQMPPSLHFQQGNPHIDFDDSPFFVNTALRDWPAGIDASGAPRPRRAALSAFGMSGTNAHLVIEEAPVQHREPVARPDYLVVLSARTAEQLRAQAERLLAHREQHADESLGDVAFTLLAGRKHYTHRLACIVRDDAALTTALTRWLAGTPSESVCAGELKEKGSRERAALKEYGQSCLAACVEGELTASEYQQKLAVLADLYVQGYALDYASLLADGGYGRVSLPTYPFGRQRYWVDAPARPAAVAAPTPVVETVRAVETPVAASDDLVSTLTLVPSWELQPVGEFSADASTLGRCVIVDDASAHEALKAHYPDAIVIDAGEATVDALAAQLSSLEPFDHVVWRLPAAVRDASPDALIAGQETGVLRGLTLLQALLRTGYGERPLALTVITQLAQAVVPGEAIDAAQASVWGLVGSAAKEQASWQVRLVDVETEAERTTLIQACAALPPDAHGNGRALRGGRWYRPVCVPCTLPAVPAPVYRRGGVYVLIGGAGGVGEVLSEQLVRQYDARVIWLGRRERDAAIEAKQQRLAQWGEAPEYIAVDARDADALRAVREQIVARHGVIHGVVHAALVMSGSDLAAMSAERFRAGLSAKVDVSVRLVEAFAGAVEDFVVFFSSIQALEKTRRQSNYAAGSTFVDAYATQIRAQLGCAVKVIDWGYWANLGAAKELASFQHWLAQAGMSAIEPAAGLDALERLIASPLDCMAYLATHRAGALQGVTFARAAIGIAAPSPSTRAALADYAAPVFAAGVVHAEAIDRMQPLQPLLLDVLLQHLHDIGPADATAVATLAEWRARSALAPEHERWWRESARLLSLHLGGDAALLHALQHPDATQRDAVFARWAQIVEAARDDEQWQGNLTLVESTVAVLPQILRGDVAATAVMFPQATMQRVQGVYRGNALTDYCNEVLAQALRRYVAARLAHDPHATLRIIEVGAGTGGTSAVVFEALAEYAAHIAEYAYTDVSKAFLHHAQERYAPTTPYLRGQVFDVERSPDAQGIATNHYDVAISTNAIHATRDIRDALRHIKATLKGNGVLLLNELSTNSVLGHLTFGLLDGWWRFEDDALRLPGCPLLAPAQWRHALVAEGYDAIGFLTPQLHDTTQVIVAHSDGVARQTRRASAAAVAATPAALVAQPIAQTVTARAPAAPRISTQLLHEHVRQAVLEKLSESLMIELALINADESFSEYGLDSLLAVRTIEALNATLGTTLTSTSLFDYGSVNKLTAHIAQAYREPLAAMLGVGEAVPAEAAPIESAQSANVEIAAELAQAPVPRAPVAVDFAQPPAIAIVGISGRYPQSPDVDTLWTHLRAGNDLTQPVTRWNLPAILGTEPYCPRGGFVDGIAEFDATFFNISGLEATHMDPQQRLFMQEAWKALEDAGYVGGAVAGRRCGVYAGYNGGDYQFLQTGPAPAQALWGSATSLVSARIAYYLDLQGPAITVDTACSSSLVAIHLASQALRTGEVDLALAGGVFVQCTPGLFLGGERAGMLSAHGRCYTFDDRADGFAPGEGVGAVVLKRLDEALADGDHIYGAIRGSGINQDGATNGITAPSAASQERLEREVYERFGINADTIDMVEAHGTGTKLGDPIEFHALTRAFRRDTQREGFCAIGSIKTNIGHTTAASGVAGVLKVLLCLAHREIAPSLNYDQSNRHIEFAGSPFYVPTQVRDWPSAPGRKRCAAVSSFGLSGTNAHVVIEEAPAHARRTQPRAGYLMVLSARNADALKQQVLQLAAHCERHADLDAGNVSHTLLAGRRHFEHRLACIVRSTAELAQRLRKWIEHGKAPQVYASRAAQLEGGGQVGLKRYAEQCMRDCVPSLPLDEYLERLASIADLHVQGYELDYAPLFASQPHARVSLPTYPFAATGYWVESSAPLPAGAAGSRGVLHPLVHENTGDVRELRYSSSIGADLLGTDVPGAEHGVLTSGAQLEMARAALALGLGAADGAALVLHDVQWGEAVVVGDTPVRVHVGLYGQADGTVDYEIYSERDDGERTLHGTGRAETATLPAVAIDAAAVRVPLQLTTPGDARYGLHPALLQQALQAVPRLAGDGTWALHSVRRVDVLAALNGDGEARLQAITRGDDGKYRCDVQLCDAQQRVCAVLHGLTFAAASADEPVLVETTASPLPAREPVTLTTWQERWIEQASTPEAAGPRRVLCVAPNAVFAQALAQAWRAHDVEVIGLWFAETAGAPASDRHAVTRDAASCRAAFAAVAAQYGKVDAVVYAGSIDTPAGDDGWRDLLPLLQGLLASGLACGRLLLCAAYDDALSRCYAESWIGIERSLRVLAPSLPAAVLVQHGALNDFVNIQRWTQRVDAELRASSLRSVRHEADRRYVLQVSEHALPVAASPLRHGGTYWITGGAGGLGAMVARHLLERYSANVILSGRRELDDAQQAGLQAWASNGGGVCYVAADVADETAMRRAAAQATERFGAIDGVFHVAGMLDADSLPEKSAETFARVLAPKVRGSQVLDAVLADQPLAFVCYFSSSSAVLGDFGSGDYALANRFELAYAEHAAGAGTLPTSRRIAIGWPVWADGGMQVGDAANTTLYLQASGQAALTAPMGLDVLERALAAPGGHCLVMLGQRTRIERALGLGAPRETAAPETVAEPVVVPARRRAELRGLSLEDCVAWELRDQIAGLLKLRRDQIQAQDNLADYGFDSITLAQWAKQISAHYAIELTPAIFFSHATLERVAAHLLDQHRASVEARYRETQAAAAPLPQASSAPLRSRRAARRVEAATTAAAEPIAAEPIAIIGMSGRFAQARSVDALWRILAEGRRAIDEVALERFDWRAGYAAGVLKSKWLGAMPGVDEFDPAFFEISPREAQAMDPRQRLLLQEAWNALEDAGYGTPQLARHTVGMFVGVEQGEYQLMVGPQATLTGTHDAILASRLSYFLDLHGPAMAINTSCSSGLVAAHQACLSLRAGECDTAIAAAASLSLTAEVFGGMSQAGMLSEDGRCYAFDRRANGMVPGEAVVALVLKRLSQAEADGDPIRAVIAGSGINYDGKTNGITAPNGALQAALIRDVYARAGVAPAEVDYVVTHGTGTRLGDPVEMDALRDVFGTRAGDAPACAITSTKSNLGHAFAASGLVSLASAVLALAHERIPPGVDCDEPSDYIDWQASALALNRTLRPWPPTAGRPRLAGVSAFGMSGTNAHMLVREYTAQAQPARPLRLVPLMLSAKSADALRQKIDDLAAVLREGAWDAHALTAMSHTLLCGRQHFTHRCAMVVEDREHALGVLAQAQAGERAANVFRGVAPREFTGQRALQQTGEALLASVVAGTSTDAAARDALHALADLYCQGYVLSWATLFGDTPPRRLALPTYPFAREPYWIDGANVLRTPGLGGVEVPAVALHPLVQRNTSTLGAQRFTSTFDGREAHLADHRVGGVPTLPGVCYLEMALAALRASSEHEADGAIELRDVVWVRPLAVTRVVDVHTQLIPTQAGDVAFDISAATDGDAAILAQGRLLRIDAAGERIDLARLRARCGRTLVADDCYALLNGTALDYGPAFRGLAALHLCDDASAPFVLAQLQLPASVEDGADRYVLHPAVLDSALQAAIGLSQLASLRGSNALGTMPFAVESVRVFAPTPRSARAHVRVGENDTIAVDLCDDSGRVCVAVRGLALLSSARAADAASSTWRTTFRSDEFFLEDHDHVVPGVVYLTLARAAGEQLAGRSVSGLADVVWRTPMRVTPAASTLVTQLQADGGFTIADESGAVCAQGTLRFDGDTRAAPHHDLDAIRERCTDAIEGHDCHDLLGVTHGPRMFPLERIVYGEREALARLVLANEGGELHPALLHGTVLAAIAYSFLQDGRPQQLRLPFALEALRIYTPSLPAVAYAVVRQRSADGAANRAYDIDLVDEAGDCLVAFEGFTALPVNAPQDGVLCAIPAWHEQSLPETIGATPADALAFVLTADDAALRGHLADAWPDARIDVLDAGTSAADITQRFTAVAALLQDCLRTTPGTTRLVVLSPDDDAQRHAPLAVLLRTARAEHARLVGSAIAYAPNDPTLIDRLRADVAALDGDVAVRYRDGVRQVPRWEELSGLDLSEQATSHDDASGLLGAGDAVWITGGLGGIGRILARWFGRIDGVRVVLSGRSAPDEAGEQWLRAAWQDGIAVDYLRCDIANRADVDAALASDALRGLRGIVHCAGTLRDGYLARKTPAEIEAVFAPKVAGTLVLDDATRDLPLAFFALYSSFAAVLGNPGQADYAGANAFLDAFAVQRNALAARGERHGHACSINWPLWQDGGMQVDAQTTALTRRMTGLAPLASAPALRAFARALHERHARMLVAQGQRETIRAVVLGHAAPIAAAARVEPAVRDTAAPADAAQTARLVRELAQAAAGVLKLRADAIDADTELSHYGFDSIYLTELTNLLNRTYTLRLMPTVFFECPTLAALARHLLARHGAELRAQQAADAPVAASPAPRIAAVPQPRSRPVAAARPPAPLPADAARTRDPVAIVGMSGRFPGCADVGEFWTRLAQNDDLIGEVPAQRWAWMHSLGASAATLPAPVRLGGFMADVDCFDPLFFGIAPLEAVAMDPQQRLFIETAWACIEDAGYRPGSLAGSRAGVFVGVSTSDYKDLCQLAGASVEFGGDSAFHFMIANRLSYLLDLHGPSESVDTACSSSLVALHRAIGALATGECDSALVGGVNVIANPVNSVRAHDAGILSSDGRCKTFDQSADGYGRGEGVAVLMLKSLSRAQADGDHIYGLVRGSAENHGGRAASPTAPNPVAQQQLLVDAYTAAGIDPRTVGYIEAHGTGTVLGDPIEFNALKAAFDELYRRQGVAAPANAHCALGSVKTNIGHLEAAAGVAGVIKVLLMMRHARIPGNRHLASPNRYLELDGSPFRLARDTHDWAAPHDASGAVAPRRAGVSSFGIGGANAHVVLEEYRVLAGRAASPAKPAIVVVSAKTRERLGASARQLLHAFERDGDASLHDVAYTLQIGRDAMEHRLAFVAATLDELRDQLGRYLDGRPHGGYENEAGKHRELFGSLIGEQALADTIDGWVRHGELAKLAELWSKGLPFDWQRLHAGSTADAAFAPRRVSLPTYPFARESYWVETRDGRPPAAERMRQRDGAAAHDDAALEHLLDGLLGNTVTLQDALGALDRMALDRTEGTSP